MKIENGVENRKYNSMKIENRVENRKYNSMKIENRVENRKYNSMKSALLGHHNEIKSIGTSRYVHNVTHMI